jgi:hypothetical protein
MSFLRIFFTCLSIAANAYVFQLIFSILLILVTACSLLAGGIFTFPLLSPVLALHLKLTQPQLTTIALL